MRTHVYTSPHLVSFRERIALDGNHIDDEALLALLEECEAVNGGAPITFFEITTAAAFLAFARAPAELALIEVGLGGQFDATNVIARPSLTAIAPVAMDHMHYLGDTLAKIAFEKAGILKAHVPAVIGRQEAEALAVIEARAAELAVPLTIAGRDYDSWTGAAPSLAGAHQRDNAAQAAACARKLGIPEDAIAAGVASAIWPGRMQRLATGRLAARLAPGWELWLDGGHNPAAARAIAAMLAEWRDRPVHLVFGMLNTRASAEFLAPLAPFAAGLGAVAIPGEANAIPAADLAQTAQRLGISAAPHPSLAAALEAIPRDGTGRVLVCGSLYLVGAALAENG
jgi:dihydrofolate synthase / folylpolyglutamate synthase